MRPPLRHITAAGLDLIRRFEGFRADVYICPAGIPTIGYGSTRGFAGETLTMDTQPITQDEALALLARDVESAERAVLRLITVPLSDGQFDALASFVHNLGGGALQRSTLRAKANHGEHGAVPTEFMKWTRGRGRILPGLVRRRRAEADSYATT